MALAWKQIFVRVCQLGGDLNTAVEVLMFELDRRTCFTLKRGKRAVSRESLLVFRKREGRGGGEAR